MDITLSFPYILIALIVVSLEVLVAIFIYVFLTVVILYDVYTKKSMDHVSKSRVALYMSNFFFTIISSANFFCDFVWPESCKMTYSNEILIILTIYSISSSAWITAIICFTYFIKILDFKSIFITRVKNEMNSIIAYVIFGVEMLCLATSFLSLLIFQRPKESSRNTSLLHPTNNTSEASSRNLIVGRFLLVLVFIPILTMVTSITVTVRFLKLQGHKLKLNLGRSSLKVYNNVVFRMVWQAVLYFIFYLVTFLFYFSVFPYLSFGYWVTMILMLSFTPTQFIMIIFHNSIVKNAWKEMFNYIMCCNQQSDHKTKAPVNGVNADVSSNIE